MAVGNGGALHHKRACGKFVNIVSRKWKGKPGQKVSEGRGTFITLVQPPAAALYPLAQVLQLQPSVFFSVQPSPETTHCGSVGSAAQNEALGSRGSGPLQASETAATWVHKADALWTPRLS